MINERGIEVDPNKIRAILDMPPPRTGTEIQGFLVDYSISTDLLPV